MDAESINQIDYNHKHQPYAQAMAWQAGMNTK